MVLNLFLVSLIDLASWRTIGKNYYIKANVNFEYGTKEHKFYLVIFITPFLLVFLLFIPGFFYLKLYLNRTMLHRVKFRIFWGYLYNEYRDKVFFWEFAKMFVKIGFILTLSLYHELTSAKATFLFLILYRYNTLA